MIYEARTYRVKPRSLGEVLKRFETGYQIRKKRSELAAFFYTEIGPLNQIIHIWPYADLAERAEIRALAAQDDGWPPAIGEFVERQNAEVFIPSPFTPVMAPAPKGWIYEWREYILKPGAIPAMMKSWGDAIEARTKLSPLSMAMYSELGDLNKWVHIWAYENLEHRREVRAEAQAKGIWPPGGGDYLVSQENKIVLSAPFSPM
jgi:NIPSNAP